MSYSNEKETFERLTKDRNNLVFWKRDIAFEDERGIVTQKRWTTSENYLIGNKLHKLGTNEFLCESWIDEDYLEKVSGGQNIVVVTE